MSDELKACEWCGKPLGKFELHERLHCVYALRERAEKAEAMVERMIEAGNELDIPPDDFSEEQKEWREIVAEWRGRDE